MSITVKKSEISLLQLPPCSPSYILKAIAVYYKSYLRFSDPLMTFIELMQSLQKYRSILPQDRHNLKAARVYALFLNVILLINTDSCNI